MMGDGCCERRFCYEILVYSGFVVLFPCFKLLVVNPDDTSTEVFVYGLIVERELQTEFISNKKELI